MIIIPYLRGCVLANLTKNIQIDYRIIVPLYTCSHRVVIASISSFFLNFFSFAINRNVYEKPFAAEQLNSFRSYNRVT